MFVPSRIREVAAAMWVRSSSGSRIGASSENGAVPSAL
jgi:hypothetical protein